MSLAAIKPNKEDHASVRRRILSEARRRFFMHGFRSVTMEDLAADLGMSKKTLYAHFSGKTLLLRAVLRDKFESIEADLDGVISESSIEFFGSMHKLLDTVQRHTEEIQPPFLRDIQREAPDLFKLVESRRREIILRHFGRLFVEGCRTGVFRKDVPSSLVIEILLGATEAIMNPLKLADLDLTPKSGFTAIIKVIFQGILTEKMRLKI